MVYQLSLNLLGDHNEALDLSQEVFLRVFRTIHSFRGHSALRTWIYRIVVNQARNRQRWWRRRHRVAAGLARRAHPRSRRAAGRTATAARRTGCSGRSSWPSGSASRSTAAVRSDDRARAARNRRPELRRDRVLARHRRRDGEIAAGARPRSAARAIEGRMTLLTCAAVRRRLAAFHDRELPVARADCRRGAPARLPAVRPRSARAAGRSATRCGWPRRRARPTTGPACARASSAGCAPRRTSRGPARARRAFDDMHLVWIGLAVDGRDVRLRGAVAARHAALRVARARTTRWRAMIAVDGRAVRIGSESRPARRPGIQRPERAGERHRVGDARERSTVRRRIWCCRCRRSSRAKGACRARGARATTTIAREVVALLVDELSRGRLEPAQFGGVPVAVNLVWLVAHTTVKPSRTSCRIVNGRRLDDRSIVFDLPPPPSRRCSSRRSRG